MGNRWFEVTISGGNRTTALMFKVRKMMDVVLQIWGQGLGLGVGFRVEDSYIRYRAANEGSSVYDAYVVLHIMSPRVLGCRFRF